MIKLIECEDLHSGQREEERLVGVHLELKAGQRLVVFPRPYGPAAHLINICATLEEPDRGEVRLFGQNVDFADELRLLALRRKIAMVHSESVLISNFTITENVTLGVCYHDNKKLREAAQEVRGLMERLDLESCRAHRPSEIDPYRRRRALYAMEIMKKPRVVLFDQPFRDFPGDDFHYFEAILEILGSDPSRGIMIATQNKGFISRWADSVLVLKDGRIRAFCEPSALDSAIEQSG
jgi:ABC-type polar amino acid transport system ATPase subunit